MKLFLSFISLLLLCMSLPSHAIEPYITETNRLHFGELIYIPGGCVMDYDTRLLTNNTPANICITSHGQLGKYRIFSNPNTTVSINVKAHNDDGSGIIFVPEGRAISDAENKTFLANTGFTIDSGTSGIIDIHVGGRIQINAILSSNTNYLEDFDIDFTEL